jgi:hypothetical protein
MKMTLKQVKQIIKEELQRIGEAEDVVSTQDASNILAQLTNLITSVGEADPEAQKKLMALKNQMVQTLKASAFYADVDPGFSTEEPKKAPVAGHTRGPGITPQKKFGGTPQAENHKR